MEEVAFHRVFAEEGDIERGGSEEGAEYPGELHAEEGVSCDPGGEGGAGDTTRNAVAMKEAGKAKDAGESGDADQGGVEEQVGGVGGRSGW